MRFGIGCEADIRQSPCTGIHVRIDTWTCTCEVQVADFFGDATAIEEIISQLGGMILPERCYTRQLGQTSSLRRAQFAVSPSTCARFWQVRSAFGAQGPFVVAVSNTFEFVHVYLPRVLACTSAKLPWEHRFVYSGVCAL